MPSKISILIPVYNEWKTIRQLLEKLVSLRFDKEIVVVNDGSSDGTTEILESFSHPLIRVFRHPGNQGKGAAIRTGLSHCAGEVIIIQDADFEQDPEDIYQIVQPILEGKMSVVYGSRFLGRRPKMRWSNYIANIFLSRLASLLYGRKITDVETCYKAFRADLIRSIRLEGNGFEFEPEITAKILKKGYSIHEVPVKDDWYEGHYNNSKKVTGWDGIKAVLTLLRYRFRD